LTLRLSLSSAPSHELPSAAPSRAPSAQGFVRPTFDHVYAETFPAVWRTARRLGVVESAVDDVVQEVYVTVYRRLEQFEGRSSLKTWVFGILLHVVNNYRRSRRRKGAGQATAAAVEDPALLIDENLDPMEQVSRAEAGRIVRELLSELDEDKAAVFVLAELEGLSVPEIAQATSSNVNTVYSRLRAARKAFDRSLKRRRARSKEPSDG
jgi:RNA polymerase sigma-70 factor (ECF subfamily)